MRKNEKKALYESIMMDIAKLVKRAINKNVNESYFFYDDDYSDDEYDDEFFTERGIDPHSMDFAISKTYKYSRDRIYVDISEVVKDNPEDFKEDLKDLKNEVRELVPDVIMTEPVVGKAVIDFVTFTCYKSDEDAVKAMIRNSGYKIIGPREQYKLGLREKKPYSRR